MLTPIAVAAALTLSLLGTWAARAAALRAGTLDHPGQRSSHVVPTPRVGGVGIMLGFLFVGAVVAARAGSDRATIVLTATGFVALVGLADDLRGLPAAVRLAAHFAAAVAVLFMGRGELGPAWSLLGGLPRAPLAVVSLLWVVWVTNLYNFMDGIDGLAGGQAVIAGVAMAVASHRAGAPLSAALAAVLAAAAAGFLLFNFPPATIFMGDAGSTSLGFLFATFPFLGEGHGAPAEAVALALSLFILDATSTLLRRILRGEDLARAHRSHWFQRPLAHGITHRAVTLSAYAGMAIVAVGAATLDLRRPGVVSCALLGASLLFAGYASAVRAVERKRGA